MVSELRIGTAGWTVPRHHGASFPLPGSHLQRYSQRLNAAEINSSFYRPHRPETYARWAASAPSDFRFAVKLPREITHLRKLVDIVGPLEKFLGEVRNLGEKIGPLLVQLPPSLVYSGDTAVPFFTALRARFAGGVVCEPRHPTWFAPEADRVLTDAHVARVAADPAPVPAAAQPGGWSGLTYRRLHGSPQMYASPYSDHDLDRLASDLRRSVMGGSPAWCIFDNTARGEAAGNAIGLSRRLPAGFVAYD